MSLSRSPRSPIAKSVEFAGVSAPRVRENASPPRTDADRAVVQRGRARPSERQQLAPCCKGASTRMGDRVQHCQARSSSRYTPGQGPLHLVRTHSWSSQQQKLTFLQEEVSMGMYHHLKPSFRLLSARRRQEERNPSTFARHRRLQSPPWRCRHMVQQP